MRRPPSAMTPHRLSTALAAVFVLVVLLGCGKFLRGSPDAGPPTETPTEVPTTDAAVDLDAMFGALIGDPPVVAILGDAGCPQPIRPGYCRRSCRTFGSRQATKHARRVVSPTRHAFGTCGPFKVFAEDDKGGGGVVEYYDTGGNLVGAVDKRQKACGQYGTIPTCSAVLKWEATPTVKDGLPTVQDDDDVF